jgi:hypothetical protein
VHPHHQFGSDYQHKLLQVQQQLHVQHPHHVNGLLIIHHFASDTSRRCTGKEGSDAFLHLAVQVCHNLADLLCQLLHQPCCVPLSLLNEATLSRTKMHQISATARAETKDTTGEGLSACTRLQQHERLPPLHLLHQQHLLQAVLNQGGLASVCGRSPPALLAFLSSFYPCCTCTCLTVFLHISFPVCLSPATTAA